MPLPPIYVPVSTPTEIRAKSTAMLNKVVDDPNIARFLERAVWNHAVIFCKKHDQALAWDNASFRNAYTQKILGVRYIARERPDVLDRYMSADPTLKTFVNAKPWELWPERWETAFEDAARKALRFADADSSLDPDKMPDGLIQCRCGSWKTSFTERQTRAADEPKRHGQKSIAPHTSGPCAWETRLDFQTLFMVYVSC